MPSLERSDPAWRSDPLGDDTQEDYHAWLDEQDDADDEPDPYWQPVPARRQEPANAPR